MIEAVMSPQMHMLSEFAWDSCYAVSDTDDMLTPALVIYPEIVASNIERTLHLLNGDADRWRVHNKNTFLRVALASEPRHPQLQCATTLELLVACQSGAGDAQLIR
jgi:hypothetical protein